VTMDTATHNTVTHNTGTHNTLPGSVLTDNALPGSALSVATGTRNRLRVMMITEGTYPYYWGGVSTWCHLLLSDLPNFDFTLVSLVSDPAARPQFNLPASVVEFRPIPIWGVRESLEAQQELRAVDLWSRKRRTANHTVAHEFVPRFRAFVEELFAETGNPQRLAATIHAMHRFFLRYDFDKAMRSQIVWNCFVHVVQHNFPRTAALHGYAGEPYTLADLTTCFHWLYHWLFPLASPLPKVDIAHAAMAGMCTLVAVAVKLEHGASFMLTEHGIYLRERYLAEAASSVSLFRKLFSLRFARRMTELSYALADMVAPCCDFNQRWELRNGAKAEQLKTIYYGVDPVVFTPKAKPAGEPPVVVWVGRIDPLKDLFTLLRSAAIVHAERPDIEFRLFGSVPAGNEEYYEQCLELRRELGLDQTVVFAGFRSNPVSAFNEGDIAVLSSVSEAFPFVILEAMLCEKPVVATAVGGVPEQIEECGIIVEPRNYEAMAQAILMLINDPELCQSLGLAARQKAVQEYSVRQSAQAHEAAYLKMASRKPGAAPLRPLTSHRHELRAIPFLRARSVSSSNRHSLAADASRGLVRSARSIPIGSDLSAMGSAGLEAAHPHPAPRVDRKAQTANESAGRNGAHELSAGGAELAPVVDPQWHTQFADNILQLAAEVAQRGAQPVDGLEVTAILESIGITDDVAVQRYGAPNVFVLGEEVFRVIRSKALALRLRESPNAVRVSRKDMVLDYLKGPLGLAPPLLLLLAIAAVSTWGGWTQQQTLMLSAGLTASLMVTNGLVQGIGRRTALYLGMLKPRMASRYLFASTSVVTTATCGLILVAAYALRQFNLMTDDDLRIFVLSFMGLTVVWMAAGGLSLLQRPYWLSIAVAAGLLCGATANAALMPYTGWHLAIGATFGYIATLAVIVLALRHGFAVLGARPSSQKNITSLPPLPYLIGEAMPYFSYGFAYMILIFLPHLFGWLGHVPEGQTRAAAMTNIEVGLTLSMPPLILAYGAAEHALRLFWRRVTTMQATTSATNVDGFGASLVDFVAKQRRIYMLILTIFTLLAHGVFRYSLTTGWINHWLRPSDPDQLLFIFSLSLVAYWLLGLGLFNSMFAVTLGKPQVAFRAVLWGCLVLAITGVMLSSLSFTLAAFAFVLAALAFAAISWEETNQVLWTADYSFAAVLS
jgi:glycosyltransferase involved in cell wall biosynthesis